MWRLAAVDCYVLSELTPRIVTSEGFAKALGSKLDASERIHQDPKRSKVLDLELDPVFFAAKIEDRMAFQCGSCRMPVSTDVTASGLSRCLQESGGPIFEHPRKLTKRPF